MITIASLIGAGVAPTQAKLFADLLREACAEFTINTPKREAAFISQAIHESNGFTHLEENLFYTTPERIRAIFSRTVPTLEIAKTLARNPKALANRVYANKNGNGDEASGDGWMYRGRGIFQLTGKNNYAAAALDLGQPYTVRPELVAMPLHATLTAAHYWSENGCNDLADHDDIPMITRRINGPGMVGLKERTALYHDAMEAFA